MGDVVALPEQQPVYWLTISYTDRVCGCGAPIPGGAEFVYRHEPEPTSLCFACAAEMRISFTPSKRWCQAHGRMGRTHRGSQLRIEERAG